MLPFANMSGDPEQEFFADGLTEDIITELSRFRDLLVISRNSTFVYKGKAVKVQDVAREFGVDYVIEGSVRKAGDRVRVTVQLIDAETDRHIWAERYDGELKDIFAIQDEMTRAIAATLPARSPEPIFCSIDIEVEGAAAELNIKPITGAVLAGVMRTWSDTVNMVNAPYLAKERGIAVREIRNEGEGDYHTLIAVSVGTEHGRKRVEGTLFANRAPRLVEIFGIAVEAELTGQMIYIVNDDQPGFIGALWTKLGENRINIATFNLGRRKEAGDRVRFFNLFVEKLLADGAAGAPI